MVVQALVSQRTLIQIEQQCLSVTIKRYYEDYFRKWTVFSYHKEGDFYNGTYVEKDRNKYLRIGVITNTYESCGGLQLNPSRLNGTLYQWNTNVDLKLLLRAKLPDQTIDQRWFMVENLRKDRINSRQYHLFLHGIKTIKQAKEYVGYAVYATEDLHSDEKMVGYDKRKQASNMILEDDSALIKDFGKTKQYRSLDQNSYNELSHTTIAQQAKRNKVGNSFYDQLSNAFKEDDKIVEQQEYVAPKKETFQQRNFKQQQKQQQQQLQQQQQKQSLQYSYQQSSTPQPSHEDGYLVRDLFGCEVINLDNSQSIGIIMDHREGTGTYDVLKIEAHKKNDKEKTRYHWFPFAQEYVKKVNLQQKKLYIKPLEGLFE